MITKKNSSSEYLNHEFLHLYHGFCTKLPHKFFVNENEKEFLFFPFSFAGCTSICISNVWSAEYRIIWTPFTFAFTSISNVLMWFWCSVWGLLLFLYNGNWFKKQKFSEIIIVDIQFQYRKIMIYDNTIHYTLQHDVRPTWHMEPPFYHPNDSHTNTYWMINVQCSSNCNLSYC